MSINYVQITPADEEYAPPDKIIELTVIGDGTDQVVHEDTKDGRQYYELKYARKLVFLSLSKYEEKSGGSTTQREIEFPAIDLNDLLRALSSFGIGVQSWYVGDPPTRLPLAPEDTKEKP